MRRRGSRRSRRRIRHDPQMGTGAAKSHELSADAKIAYARNPGAYNPGSARYLSRLFLEVLPDRRYPAGPGCDGALTDWPVDGGANRSGVDIASRFAKIDAEAHGTVPANTLSVSAEDNDVEADRGRGAHWQEVPASGLFCGCRDLRRTFPTGEESQ